MSDLRRVGVVGADERKWSEIGKLRAIELIGNLLGTEDVTLVSGDSPAGGVDVWAYEIARKQNGRAVIFGATINKWSEPDGSGYGFKARNIDIAKYSDELHVIVPDELPANYQGEQTPICWHCHSANHIKSGGCYTGKAFEQFHPGKRAVWHTIANE